MPPLKGMVPADMVDLHSRQFGPLSALIVSNLILKYRPQIVELQIDKNPIEAAGAAEVAKMIKVNDDIKVLDVRFCALRQEGMAVIAEALRVNSSVTKVLALSNRLGNDGARAVEAMLQEPYCALRHLDIQDNLIEPGIKTALKEAAKKHPGLTLVL